VEGPARPRQALHGQRRRRRETMAPGPLPPGHRLGVRCRQALQTPRLGRRVHRAHLPWHTLPDTLRRRRRTHSKEGNTMISLVSWYL